jgi:signal transduction histidine kinase
VVSDSGVGIPSSEQAEVFTRFFRSSTAQARESQGQGLGLSVVETIVRRHGGTVALDSDHMQGATFTVTIPLVAEQRAAGSAA